MGAVEQMEIFPSITDDDKVAAKYLLQRYGRMIGIVRGLAKKKLLTEKECQVYSEYSKKTEALEMAVSLIIDDNVRRVMEFRFIRGNSRWGTVKRFNFITDRSIDRRIVRGVESVAETLKLIGVI
ncbi:hypothetical protein [Paenibacillus sp. FSL R5-808]|jgi:hypothetical protein|uniref:hypothetical protein n=1 Tax=Paenibacillus sp. FSL R5-808 TaxID=1227076 RepID=UPI0003E206BB|nr:hypothetical protein [Paenibacillus sp. FSL R5-808]ETT33289.1 hypothetical protein C169_22875 [Paenibacillus sp. FSL R5-808]